jgi:glycosyltransferase involved in cell wall biosynthesis
MTEATHTHDWRGMGSPLVSVVMPCHTEKYLVEAVQSILDQTYPNFELIAICDPDNMDIVRALHGFKDRRIKAVDTQFKVNVSDKMNLARALTRGKYVARMDSDDLAHPDRLEKQVAFLDAHPDIGVVGTQMEYVNEDGTHKEWLRLPTSFPHILWALPRYNPIANPAVMMRAEIFRELWHDPAITTVEDYDYWVRAARLTKIENLPDYLHKYRIHPANTSKNNDERNHWVPAIQEKAKGIFWERLGGCV